MKIRNILLIALVFLVIFAVWATIFNPNTSVVNIEPKENVSIAVTGDVMFARNMAGVLSMDSSPFSGVSDVTSNVDLLLINDLQTITFMITATQVWKILLNT